MVYRFTRSPLFIPVIIIGVIGLVVSGIFAYQAATTEKPTDAERAQIAAVTQARKIADEYLQALMICDLSHLNKLRQNPMDDAEFSKCNIDKQASIVAQSGNLISYEKLYDASLKTNVETAVFLPMFSKDGQAQQATSLLTLERLPEKDNIWKVIK